eukprot:1956208-Alexandrium_andersonii.AAC.1
MVMAKLGREGGQDFSAAECLWRAVTALNHRDRVDGYSPAQHALGRAPAIGGIEIPGRSLVCDGSLDADDYRRAAEQSRLVAEKAALEAIQESRIRRAEKSKNHKLQNFTPGTL